MKFKTYELYNALRFVAPAVSTDRYRNPAFEFLRFKSDGKNCEIIGLNSMVLHVAKIKLAEAGEPEELSLARFDVDPDKKMCGFTEIKAEGDNVRITQISDHGERSQTVQIFKETSKPLDHTRILDQVNEDEYSICFDPQLLAKTLKAFSGARCTVKLCFKAGKAAGIDPRMPLKIINTGNFNEIAIIMPYKATG
jgi:hypothetical protein